MKKIVLTGLLLSTGLAVFSQKKIEYKEYDLPNGIHVILHQEPSTPIVAVSVLYHVGSKNEIPERTGFAHFFEHLLFEGSENIGRGEYSQLVEKNGGALNANTSQDRTFYYELLPSNQLELGLWLESERMLHAKVDIKGIETQRSVVKEEKRQRVDNQPYGNLIKAVKQNMFKVHPYKWTTIGEMEHLDAATLEEFQAFNKKFYVPNNAVLVVAGQFDKAQAKEWITNYFGAIPKGAPVARQKIEEAPITEAFKATWEDPNIQIPMLVASYRTPSMKSRDARVLDMISTYLSDGKSSKLYKKIVDDKKMALQIGAFNYSQEDYGMYLIYGLPMGENTAESILKEIDEEIVKMQTELISETDFQKLQNKFESNYVSNNASVEGIADNLATYYMLYGDINLINTEIDIYRSITREEIRAISKKYLNANQRLILDYVPAKDKAQN
jgi:predicted Zn-dependent peptidase